MMTGANGDTINAYLARPLGPGPYPAMVLAHHMPGWDQWYRETTQVRAAWTRNHLAQFIFPRRTWHARRLASRSDDAKDF